MQAFTTLTAIAAPLPMKNVDTDMIIPKQFLKTIKRTGLKEGLFHEMRFTVKGEKIADFVLHREPYTDAKILVSLDNFGCGSSREHAPWALNDFGIRVVIAPSFADIFYNNCFKNGMLPIVVSKEVVSKLMAAAESDSPEMTVDLSTQTITANSESVPFDVDVFRKHCLINGLDDIGLTLEHEDKISAFEISNRHEMPWLYSA